MPMLMAAWILFGQTTMMQCHGQTCTPVQGLVTQEVRRFPTQDACNTVKRQMEHTVGSQTTYIDQIDPSNRMPGVLRHAIQWGCRPATGERGE
jgi:hypothetical protein